MNIGIRVWSKGKEFISFLFRLFLVSILVFVIVRVVPGDPLLSYYGDRAERLNEEEREKAKELLGISESIPIQYKNWLLGVMEGDFGISYQYKKDVTEVVKDRLLNTLLLGGGSTLLTIVLALFVGVILAEYEDSFMDRVVCKLGTIQSCIPDFFLSLLFIGVFAVTLQWFPSSGAYSFGNEGDMGVRVKHLVLPFSVLVLNHLWYYGYMIRNMVLEELDLDYALLAKTKGLRKSYIIWKHCIPNVLPTYLSLIALSLPHLLIGSYVVEYVFSYPGIASLLYESIRYHDYNMILFLCLCSAFLVMLSDRVIKMINKRMVPRFYDTDRKRRSEGESYEY